MLEASPLLVTRPSASSFVITGGLGGLGLLAARQLAESGASHLLLCARSAQVDARLYQLLAPRVMSHVIASDVSDAAQVELLMDGALGLGVQLRGVLHAAGCSTDHTLRHMAKRHFTVVIGPKATSAARLRHAALRASLAAMLLYSSVTAALGNVGQTNYALANGALDALASWSRTHGQAACSLQPLPVSGVGMGDNATVSRLEADLGGLFSLRPSEMSAWLSLALISLAFNDLAPTPLLPTQLAIPDAVLRTLSSMAGRPSLAKVDELASITAVDATHENPTAAIDESATPAAVNTPLTGAALRAELLEETAPFVHVAHGALVDADAPLVQLGVDSIAAMELRVRIEARTGVRLRNVDMLSDPSVAHLAALVDQVLHARHAADTADGGVDAELAARPWLHSSVASGRAPPPNARLSMPIVLLLSSPRSGSSLLQLCLNAHSGIYAGQELFLLPFESLDERRRCLQGTGFDEGLVKTLMELYGCDYERAQASLDDNLGGEGTVAHAYASLVELALPRILVDKTPPNAERLAFLYRAYELFAAARYLQLVRHPYACIASGIELARDTLGSHASWDALEQMWVTANVAVSDFFAQVGDEAPTLVLTYEQLVVDAQSATRLVCELLSLPWEGAMASPYETDATHSFEPAARIAATDPKLLRRRALEPHLAEKWREVLLPQQLGVAAKALARVHGYELLPELPDGLVWLSRIRAAAGAPPIACIHDFTGGLWAFRDLAPLLHAPCLGVGCAPRVLNGCHTHAELAARYVQLLPHVLWPDDTPVRLLGYSLGCRIVHRMANELQRSGYLVKLILLDGPIGPSVGHAPRLVHLATTPSYAMIAEQLPIEMRRMLDAADDETRMLATQLLALVDIDPPIKRSAAVPSRARLDEAHVLYVAASGTTNLDNSVAQHALQLRPRATLNVVEGTHYSFVTASAHDVAQVVNEFLLGATALLG